MTRHDTSLFLSATLAMLAVALVMAGLAWDLHRLGYGVFVPGAVGMAALADAAVMGRCAWGEWRTSR